MHEVSQAMTENERYVPEPLNARQFADEKIRELRAKIKLAEDGDYDGNVAVMRDMLDKWLEYRQAHAPDEERLPL
jgi:hypothetical protein